MGYTVFPLRMRRFKTWCPQLHRPAKTAELSPGGPPMGTEEWSALVEAWFPRLVDRSLLQATWPDIACHHERIKDWLGVISLPPRQLRGNPACTRNHMTQAARVLPVECKQRCKQRGQISTDGGEP